MRLSFILRSIKQHVAQAHQPAIALHQDELMMRVFNHNASILRAGGVAGMGKERMQTSMEACEAGGEWWAAAQLWFAAGSLRGQVHPMNAFDPGAVLQSLLPAIESSFCRITA